MIILFAPAKTFDFDAPKKAANYEFKVETLDIINKVNLMDDQSVQKTFKLPASKLGDILDYYRHFDERESYLAMAFFKGEAYKALNYNDLSRDEKIYLNKHTYILDALYGIIRPEDGIRPYRLDFTMGMDLRSMWKKQINAYFAKNRKEPFLSLASKEFSSLIDKDLYTIFEVSFYECKNDECRAISVFNKQMRGHLLSYIVKNKIHNIASLPKLFLGYQLEVDGYKLNYKRLVD